MNWTNSFSAFLEVTDIYKDELKTLVKPYILIIITNVKYVIHIFFTDVDEFAHIFYANVTTFGSHRVKRMCSHLRKKCDANVVTFVLDNFLNGTFHVTIEYFKNIIAHP